MARHVPCRHPHGGSAAPYAAQSMAERPLRNPVDRLVGPVRDAILDRVDPDTVLDHVDPDRLLARIDVDALLDRVDVNRLLDQVDVNRLLDRVDVNRLLDRVDPDRLVGRADVADIAKRIDVADIAKRIDVDEIATRIDIDRIVSASTGRVAGSLVDVARRQLAGLDAILTSTVQRVRRQDPSALPAGPALLVDPTARSTREVTGRYAGPVTRIAAYAADVAAGSAVFTLLSAGLGYLASLLFNVTFEPEGASGILGTLALLSVLFLYNWLSITVAGRTPAMAVLGIRVVRRDGRPLSAWAAAVRTLALPISLFAFGLGFVGLLLGRERRAFHDVLAGSAVVYDWGDRPAKLPTPLGDWLDRHQPT